MRSAALILVFITLFSCCICARKTKSVSSTHLVPSHFEGDAVGNYLLHKRLDILGIQKIYLREDYPLLEASPDHGTNTWWPMSLLRDIPLRNDSGVRGEYILRDKKFLGGHGEVWLARKVLENNFIDSHTSYILKRMHIADRPAILRCAQREIHFGLRLSENPRTTHYITSFRLKGDYWLVFRDEGVSLQQLLYAVSISNNDTSAANTPPPLLQPSAIWRKLRTTSAGSELMRSLLLQVITGVNELHHLGILHRDVKPSNILLNADDASNPRLIIADFSSAVSAESMPLYGEDGPTTDEESEQYSPPEVILQRNRYFPYDPRFSYAYDAWSIGVLFLEMILGTADVFSVDQRTAALISHRMRHHTQDDIEQALWLASMAEFCIYFNSEFGDYAASPALMPLSEMRTCGIAELSKAIHRRDPLGIGYNDAAGLDLLSRLLRWSPGDRITLDQAMQHAYFVGTFESALDGTHHFTAQDRDQYDASITRAATDSPEEDMLYLSSFSTMLFSAPTTHSMHSLVSSVRSLMNVTHRTHLKNETWRHLLPSTEQSIRSHDPELDIERHPTIMFQCPKCKRTFFDDWQACYNHLRARNHGEYCTVVNRENLPHCLSDHSLLPIDEHSGWCDLIGRRNRIEDAHAVHITSEYLFVGVFDGHWGSAAAKFASRHVPLLFDKFINSNSSTIALLNISTTRLRHSDNSFAEQFILAPPIYDKRVDKAVQAIHRAITDTQNDFLTKISDAERSGSTVTAAVVFRDVIVIANVGDSRAVLCCSDNGSAVALTEDHTPLLQSERRRVEASGGFITTGQTLRVNGQLAVTRSIGNAALVDVLSSIPDITVLRRQPVHNNRSPSVHDDATPCGRLRHLWRPVRERETQHLFLIVASDGLWDVMSNQQAVDFVCSYLISVIGSDNALPTPSFQDAAKLLAQEAYVRGSTDNIGVCIADIRTTFLLD